MSSPSRNVIDPLICSYDAPNKSSPPSGPSKHSASTALPAPTKLIPPANQPATGWTPLVSRTFSADINSYNSTPSSKIFTSLYKQAGTQYTGNGAHVAPTTTDEEYPGLSLTPFLSHNINLMAQPNSAGHYSNHGAFTPFYDKSIHFTDFFMELPIRTPLKLETITPSRFALQYADSAVRQSAEPLLNVASLKKRFDPAFKRRSIEHDADKPPLKPGEDFGDEFVTPSKKKVAYKNPDQTPLRAAAGDSHNRLLQTPSVSHPVSSPSTLIMSSAVKSPTHDGGKENQAPSPTPVKELIGAKISPSEPVMGIFSEKKRAADEPRAARPKKHASGTNKFQIVLTDVHTLMNSKKRRAESKKRRRATASIKPSVGALFSGAPLASNGAPSEQGLVHNLGRSRLGQNLGPIPGPHGQSLVLGLGMAQKLATSKEGVYTGSFHDYNTSMNNSRDFSREFSNTSRDFSMLTSSSNTTHTNITSMEHASFEHMHGGSISTPNKFLLDNSFERASPMNRGRQNFDKPAEYMVPPKQAAHGRAIYGPPQLTEPMSMTMSTPQKYLAPSVPAAFVTDTILPSSRESMAFLYQHLHQMQAENPPAENKRKKR